MKMYIKPLVAMLLGLSTAYLPQANATTDFGTVSLPFTHAIGTSFAALSTVSDSYNFSISQNSYLNASAYGSNSHYYDISYGPFGYQGIVISSLSITGPSISTSAAGSDTLSSSTPSASFGSFTIPQQDFFNSAANLNNVLLTPGTYTLTVSGTSIGSTPTSYTGNLNLIAAPVPEPEEWAMMMLGFPLMGWVARRKQAVSKVSIA